MNNAEVGQGMTFEVDAPGTLGLEVTYPGTSSLLCTDNFSMTVLVDTARFDVEAGLPGTITCANPALELLGATANDPAAAIAWTTEDGAFEGPTDVATAYATTAGTYVMTVTNLDNGCAASDEVVLTEDTELPEVTLGYLDGTLDCVAREVAMNGTDIFPQEYTPMVSWMDSETGEVVSMDLDPVFNTAGVYTMVVESPKTLYHKRQTGGGRAIQRGRARLERHGASQRDHPGQQRQQRPLHAVCPRTRGHERLDHDGHLPDLCTTVGAMCPSKQRHALQWDGRANGQVVELGSYIVSVSYEATCGGVQGRPADHPRGHLLTADAGQSRFIHQGMPSFSAF